MENRALNYLSLARKAGKAELGEEPVGAAARAGKAYLIVVAQDASDHTWRRAKSFAAGTEQQVLRLKETKDELGQSIGRESLAIAAITDAALALAMVKVMEPSEAAAQVIPVLEAKSARIAKRAQEAKAHQRNVRKGKK
ncbi:MAG: ribosomal L7Ae/L30e/S12e/Gadd45 family protein [Candidatus Faecousia sp.]|nr:ribosomal L7Ae/L30e/S12e/Gadd45 family protein [Clostridiales bacterium]MDY6181272.1 ribosomal L7Ae/L30e/S12e/Gadd45 family protein [Candidatus Faecousia sp.]